MPQQYIVKFYVTIEAASALSASRMADDIAEDILGDGGPDSDVLEVSVDDPELSEEE